MVNTDDLAAIPLFASLGEPALNELARSFEVRDVSEGVELAGEGAPGYSFFVLADGSAVASAHGEEVGQIGPGDFFGEAAILTDGRRHATVTTTAPSKVYVMFGTEFRRLEAAQPDIAAEIERVMRERLAD
jgi:CRP-like cAMP-binding protein